MSRDLTLFRQLQHRAERFLPGCRLAGVPRCGRRSALRDPCRGLLPLRRGWKPLSRLLRLVPGYLHQWSRRSTRPLQKVRASERPPQPRLTWPRWSRGASRRSNSGSSAPAPRPACRRYAARAFTGRNFVVKFEGCYHGHSDAMLVKAGSGVATLGLGFGGGPGGDRNAHPRATVQRFGAVRAVFAARPLALNQLVGNAIPPALAAAGLWENYGGVRRRR